MLKAYDFFRQNEIVQFLAQSGTKYYSYFPQIVQLVMIDDTYSYLDKIDHIDDSVVYNQTPSPAFGNVYGPWQIRIPADRDFYITGFMSWQLQWTDVIPDPWLPILTDQHMYIELNGMQLWELDVGDDNTFPYSGRDRINQHWQGRELHLKEPLKITQSDRLRLWIDPIVSNNNVNYDTFFGAFFIIGFYAFKELSSYGYNTQWHNNGLENQNGLPKAFFNPWVYVKEGQWASYIISAKTASPFIVEAPDELLVYGMSVRSCHLLHETTVDVILNHNRLSNQPLFVGHDGLDYQEPDDPYATTTNDFNYGFPLLHEPFMFPVPVRLDRKQPLLVNVKTNNTMGAFLDAATSIPLIKFFCLRRLET